MDNKPLELNDLYAINDGGHIIFKNYSELLHPFVSNSDDAMKLYTWLTDQLGLGWVNVDERLPEDDGMLPVDYCSYAFNGNSGDLIACSFWCEYKFGLNEETYYGECGFYFVDSHWENTDGSVVIVERWRPLPQPPEVTNEGD